MLAWRIYLINLGILKVNSGSHLQMSIEKMQKQGQACTDAFSKLGAASYFLKDKNKS
jgi:hypothetical protein